MSWTHDQKMAATDSALKSYRFSLGPGYTHPDALKTEEHMAWRDDYDAWLVAQRSKVKNGFPTPPGLETPPPPPTP